MSLTRRILIGLRTLFRRDAVEQELADEVEHYVEMEAAVRMRAGMSPDEARRTARASLGGAERIKEEARSEVWEFALAGFLRDVRHGARSLRRNPAFTLAAVMTLAVGIAGNTTVFSLVNAAMLRPPPHVRAPEQLVSIFTSDYSGPPFGSTSYPDFEDFRAQTQLFSGMTAISLRSVGVGEGDDLRTYGMEMVGGDYFGVLGVQPAAGRFFAPDEQVEGVPAAVAVISHALWQQRFAATPSTVGGTVRLNGRTFTVVGVAPEGFLGIVRGLAMDVWIPASAASLVGVPPHQLSSRGSRDFLVVGRLAPGANLTQAQAGMATVAKNLAASYPDNWTDVKREGRRITLVSERDSRIPPQARGAVLGFVALLMGTVALVLLVCCANVAGLMLARATGRAREMGVRLSLGATRLRVLRQVLTEGALVALAGGVVGTVMAIAATRAIAALQLPLPTRIGLDLGIDWRVLSFTAAAVVLTGVLFGLVPALRASRTQVTGMLKGDGAVTTVRGRRVSLQGVLVVGQLAISMLLLVGALLFLRSLQAASAIDPGFAVNDVLLFDAAPRPDVALKGLSGETAERIRQQLAALPGVSHATWGSATPLGISGSRRGLVIEGYRASPGEDLEFHFNIVGPSYFETMQVPLLAGRGITEADRSGGPLVAVVNESFARRFWPGQSPIGKRVSTHGPAGPWTEVVGLARDAKYLSLTESERPYLYYAGLQVEGDVVMQLRASVPLAPLRDAVRRAVETVAPDWQVSAIRTMEEQVGTSLVPQRIAGMLLSLFGVVALLLAGIGLYGVVAYAVAARTREIGVRVALGARRRDVVRLVVGQGVQLAVVGVAIGLPAGWAIARLLSAFVIGGAASNVGTYAGAAVLLVGVATLAAWLPARRAASVHPMVALRDDS